MDALLEFLDAPLLVVGGSSVSPKVIAILLTGVLETPPPMVLLDWFDDSAVAFVLAASA